MRHQPPGPGGLPVVGNARRYAADPFEFMTACAEAYGDVIRLRLGPMETFMLTNPEDVEQVLVTEARKFRKPRFGDDAFDDLLGEGLLLSEGETWRRQRDLAQPAFRMHRITGLDGMMTRRTASLLDSWDDGDVLDVQQEMAGLTVAIIVDAMFGAALTPRQRRVIEEHLEPLGARFEPDPFRVLTPSWVPTAENRSFDRSVRALEDVIDELVAARRGTEFGVDAAVGNGGNAVGNGGNAVGNGGNADEYGGNAVGNGGGQAGERRRGSGEEGGPLDLLSILLRAQARGEQSDRQLRDELMTMLLAGHDTTALALTYTWVLLSAHPEWEARVHAELDEVVGDGPATAADARRLETVERVLQESMRLYPPVYTLFREAKTDVRLGGYRVPAGTAVMLPQWVLHRSPRWWDDPETFDPDRFAPGRADERPRYAYFPFGGGPRVCIGRQFSLLEAKLVLATVASRYRLERVGEGPLSLRGSLTMHPRDPVEMRVRER